MYCPNCGTANQDVNRFCLQCGAALPKIGANVPVRPVQQPSSTSVLQSSPRTADSKGLLSTVTKLIGLIGTGKLLLVIGAAGIIVIVIVAASPKHPAVKVVEDMYNALGTGDMNALIDTMLPENRQRANPLGLLSAMSISAGPVGFDVSKIAQTPIRDLNVKLLRFEGSDYALVQAEGFIRSPVLLIEVHFCDQHDVLFSGGRWYVDFYAPQREKRLRQVMNQQLQELQNSSGGIDSSGDFLSDFLGSLGPSMERTLDLCP